MNNDVKLIKYNLAMEEGAMLEAKAYFHENAVQVLSNKEDKRKEMAEALTCIVNAQIKYREALAFVPDGAVFIDAIAAVKRCDKIKARFLEKHNDIVFMQEPDTM